RSWARTTKPSGPSRRSTRPACRPRPIGRCRIARRLTACDGNRPVRSRGPRTSCTRAVHVGGSVTVAGDSGAGGFWWLDDKDARFALKFSFQGSISQVVRIDRPKPAEPLAGLTTPACRASVPGVYFLTDSAELLPASRPAIQRIAEMLKAHPDWSVTI